ncbi:MAG: nucleoside hydrolase, partial [Dehalococcoidia bacterium]|nr:nucleoside hydrolase [Dehalococcoidia bacterium]
PPPKVPLHPDKAWDFLARLVWDAPGEVALIATGPLTNVAYAFRRNPKLPELMARLVLMGGAYRLTPYGEGNRTLYAEFNIWQDPEAAHMVFNSGADIFAVGLDVTMDPAACLTSEHLGQIKTGHTPAAHLVAQLVEYQVKHHGCCRMHDPLALAMLLDVSLLDFKLARVEVVKGNDWNRGVTRILPSVGSHSIHVACAVDGPRFLELFLSRMLEK